MRKTKVGSIHEAVGKAYSAAGGLECAADDLAMSPSALSRANDPYDENRIGGLGINHLHRLAVAVPASAVPIAEHFGRLAGGKFVYKGNGPQNCIADITTDFADVLRVHAESHSPASPDPTKLTPDEAGREIGALRSLAAHIDAQIKFAEGFL